MRALTWKNPFGTLMLHGKIETRTWPTNYRGPVLICLSKQPYNLNSVASISGMIQLSRIQRIVGLGDDTFDLNGHAIAIADLVECRRMTKSDEDACFVMHYSDLWCHVYENVRRIEAFPWKGKQGWTTLSEDQIKSVRLLELAK